MRRKLAGVLAVAAAISALVADWLYRQTGPSLEDQLREYAVKREDDTEDECTCPPPARSPWRLDTHESLCTYRLAVEHEDAVPVFDEPRHVEADRPRSMP